MSKQERKTLIKTAEITFWIDPEEYYEPQDMEIAENLADGLEKQPVPGYVTVEGWKYPFNGPFICEFDNEVHPYDELGAETVEGYCCKDCLEKLKTSDPALYEDLKDTLA